MANIKSIKGREILDSRSDVTLEVEVFLEDGSWGRASVPSGASTGKAEAYKITDIKKSLSNLEIIAKNLIGQDAVNQDKIDLLMINTDGTPNKENLGANVMLAISLATCQASAMSQKQPLYQYIMNISKLIEKPKMPTPLFNIINGGKHADNNLPFQEFMIIPVKNTSYKEKLFIGAKIYNQLKSDLKKINLSVAVGDEGGFAPQLNSNEEALELIVSSIQNAGYKPLEEVAVGIDVAASSIPDLNAVTYPELPIDYYQMLVEKYPIILLEDPLSEDDWNGWVELNAKIGSRIKLVGDDIFTTNPNLLERGVQKKAANSVIIKPDQIGTLTETFRTIQIAKQANYSIIVSHRSGETESTFIADLAVGIGAEYIKTGAPARGERVAKYNELLRIEEKII